MNIRDIATQSIAAILALSLTACGGGGASSPPPLAPGIVLSKTTLSTSEDGTEDSFSVVLTTQPIDDVYVEFTVTDSGEGELMTSSLGWWSSWGYMIFTPLNWNVPQTARVRGVSDMAMDGDQTYSIVTFIDSWDLSYLNVTEPTLSVTNIDTTVKSITVSKSSLSTTENGFSQSFSVGLNLAPSGIVTVPLTISDASEGSFSSTSIVTTKTLTFDQNNYWSQTVYVYDVDDVIADGPQTYDITVGPSSSTADAGYDGISGNTVSVTNADDDMAGFTLNKTAVSTTEWGQTADFTVVLNTQPTADVTIPVTSPDTTEGLVSSLTATPAAALDLTFTSADWNIPQTVTVTGQDDTLQDGDAAYNIAVGAPTGAAEYALLSAQTVGVVNIDDDTARVSIQGADLQTTEAGAADTFVVSLAKAPIGDVVINVTSNDTTEALVKGGNSLTPIGAITLTFNATNWQTAQTVTVVGQDDLEVDGNQNLTIGVAIDTALTTDVDYDPLASQSVAVTNADNDVAGMTVSGTSLTITEGTTKTFTVNLNTKPTADVIVPVTAQTPADVLVENGASGPVSTLNLTFTPVDWATPQTVTVHAVDDFLDENYSETHYITVGSATSTDPNYNGLASKTKTTYIYDNDTAGFVVTPISGLVTSEDGTLSASFTVKLATEPFQPAFLNVSSGNTAEGLLSIAAAPTPASAVQLQFTAADWNTTQTVTVHGVDDLVLDGPTTYNVTVGSISGYTAPTKTVAVTNNDSEVGVSEVKPLTIAGLPYNGQVAPASTSSYSMALSAGWKYTVTANNVTDDISLSVKDSTGTTTLCSSATAGAKAPESCIFTTPVDGSVSIVIDGAATTNGAGFTLSLSEPMITTRFETYGVDGRDMFLYDDPTLASIKTLYSWGAGSGSFTYDLVAGKTYYLKVNGYYTTTFGAYKVQVTQGVASLLDAGTAISDTAGEPADDSAIGGSILTLDTPLERYQSSGNSDWFVYTTPIP